LDGDVDGVVVADVDVEELPWETATDRVDHDHDHDDVHVDR
jgi:hypothetical protein